jgi:hypothetical protein
MPSKPSKQQLRIEVERFIAMQKSASNETAWLENPIRLYPDEAYRPKSSIKKMMTADLYEGFCSLLNELHALNEEYAGEPYHEVSILFAVTGITQPLQDLMLEWIKSFLTSRLAKYNPKDANDEFLKLDRLIGEYYRLFPRLDHSACEILLGVSCAYAAHFLYEHTLAKIVPLRNTGKDAKGNVLEPLDTEGNA